MKKLILVSILISLAFNTFSQEKQKYSKDTLLKELAEGGCKCIDSIDIYNKEKSKVSQEISKCISKQTGPYQMISKLVDVGDLKENAKVKNGKKDVEITFNTNENSAEYKKYYYELERYMMANCASLKEKLASNEKQSEKSFSDNKAATEFYSLGLKEANKENYEKAAEYFEKAVKEDPEFAFAWDNLGINYRRLNNYDKAIYAYQQSLKVDPFGVMPLQNIAVAYVYKKEYTKAIEAYERLAELDDKNPEIYYGIGVVYTNNLMDYEKGLDNMCKAYNLYIEQKSPYRSDAEQVISVLYSEMKKQGKEKEFYKILKDNHISTEKE